MKNVEGAGAATAKTGDNRKALDRKSGYDSTCGAMDNKTRSGYPASKTNNLWQSITCGYGDNENIKGYGS